MKLCFSLWCRYCVPCEKVVMRGRVYVSVGGLRLGLGVRSDVGCGGRSGLGFWGVRDVHKKGTKS